MYKLMLSIGALAIATAFVVAVATLCRRFYDYPPEIAFNMDIQQEEECYPLFPWCGSVIVRSGRNTLWHVMACACLAQFTMWIAAIILLRAAETNQY